MGAARTRRRAAAYPIDQGLPKLAKVFPAAQSVPGSRKVHPRGCSTMPSLLGAMANRRGIGFMAVMFLALSFMSFDVARAQSCETFAGTLPAWN